jgi:NADPH:quinone reductase-like Zn-dependent oxidoreductase
VNDKDALVCIPNGNVARTSPLVPGLELTGVVSESTDPRFQPGDPVLAFDFGSTQGISRHGGFSEYARVPGDFLFRLPLEAERWAGSIDTVGGATLAYLMRTTKKGGAIAAIGVAGGAAFRATVFPLILRGIKVLGIDMPSTPPQVGRELWEEVIAEATLPSLVDLIISEVTLEDIPRVTKATLGGQTRGRILVRPGEK